VVVLVSGAASPETRPMELVVLAVVMTAFCIGLFRYALGLPIPVLVIPGVIYI
jgi:putative tricarboxylic transport membrane protein